MSDVKQCDKSGDVFQKFGWFHSLRSEIVVEETSQQATAYSPDAYELCDDCTETVMEVINE